MIGAWVEYPSDWRGRNGRALWVAARIAAITLDSYNKWQVLLVHFDGTFGTFNDITSMRAITDAEVTKYRRNYRDRERRFAKNAAKRKS